MELRFRFTAFFSLLSLLCFLCFSLLVYTQIRNRLYSNAEAQLLSHLEHDAEHLEHEHSGLHPNSKFHKSYPLSVRLWKNGTLIEDSFPKGVDFLETAESGRREAGFLQRLEVIRDLNRYVLLGWYDLEATQSYLTTLRRVLFLACFLALAVIVPLSYLSTSFLLRPFRELSQEASQLNAQKLSFRFDEPPQNDEYGILVRSFNALLKRLEKSFGEVNRFATNASHELRTPLAVILSQAEFAIRRPRDAKEYEEALKKIQDKAKQLHAVIHRLLKIAELQRAEASELQAIAVGPLIEEVKSGVSLSFPSQKMVSTAGVSSQAMYHGNLELVLSIVTNLLENAVKYSHQRVEISARAEASVLHLSIDDDGPGIPESWREQAFEPFSRNHKMTPGPGMGLGLAIVQACVLSCHGAIHLKESLLGGLRVEVILPEPSGTTE